jgi:hypothetical protein
MFYSIRLVNATSMLNILMAYCRNLCGAQALHRILTKENLLYAPLLCLAAAIDVAKGIVDSAASMVPESVPRPVAKGGVAVAGGLIAFWLLQKVRG